MHKVGYVWELLLLNCEKLRQMTLNTTLWDDLDALGSRGLPFPPTVESWKMTDARAFCFILIYVYSCEVFGRYV